jgi:hypothetical protein
MPILNGSLYHMGGGVFKPPLVLQGWWPNFNSDVMVLVLIEIHNQ